MGLQASVSCRGLQMAFRIKSKLCWLPRNGLCITAGNTGTEGKAATEGARAAAAVWKSLSNEFLKYLKINCLWKKSTHGWYAGWMGAKRKVALSFNLSSFEYSSIDCTICFLTFYSLLFFHTRTPTILKSQIKQLLIRAIIIKKWVGTINMFRMWWLLTSRHHGPLKANWL